MLADHADRTERAQVEAGVTPLGSALYVKLSFVKCISAEDLKRGLERLGLESAIFRSTPSDGQGELRAATFVCEVVRVEPKEGGPVQWHVERVPFDPFRAIDLSRARVAAVELEPGRTYHLRGMARDKTLPYESDVAAALSDMGWSASELFLMGRMVSGRMGLTIWYVRATWRGPLSVITGGEKLFFDRAEKIV